MVTLAGKPYTENQIGDDGTIRDVIMFPLKLSHSSIQYSPTQDELDKLANNRATKLANKSLDELKKRALLARKKPPKRRIPTDQITRSEAVAEYVKKAANGNCDLCEKAAPFKKKGVPFLECHHVQFLSNNGEDSIENAVALCPNCHRKMHSLKLVTDVAKLRYQIKERDGDAATR